MGLEDRDWFRDEPSGAWKERWKSSSPSSSAGSGARVRSGAWLAIAVSALVTALVWRFDVLPIRLPSSNSGPSVVQQAPVVQPPPVAQSAPAVQAPPVNATPSNVVRLGSPAGFEVPVKVPARWSVTGPRFGTVSVVVPVGKTPREALVVALAERGFQVVG